MYVGYLEKIGRFGHQRCYTANTETTIVCERPVYHYSELSSREITEDGVLTVYGML